MTSEVPVLIKALQEVIRDDNCAKSADFDTETATTASDDRH